MQVSDKNAPIGVFDSGLGGLTAVRELRRILPHENIVYFGDTGRVPYGTRGTQIIVQYAKQDIAFLLSRHVKFILAACGTVSSTLPQAVSDALPTPYSGVVAATAAAAVAASKSGRIGVIGTPATIQSGSYRKAILALQKDAQITATSCPLFVPLVENGYFGADNTVTTLVAQDYLAEIKRANVDTLILGCTHYPLLLPILAKVMGPKVTLIDAGREAAVATKASLVRNHLLCDSTDDGVASYFVSDSTENFAKFSDWFLGEFSGGNVSQIEIEQYELTPYL